MVEEDVGLYCRARIKHPNVADMLASGREPAKPADGIGEMLVVPPIGLSPAGARRRPLPLASLGRIIYRMGVIKIGARQQPGLQPIECLLERAAPPRGMEALD